ncbi:MAG: hypothetical protein DRP85_08640 [Candidatus Makaraimicrobium thalassicum]|nr:MAG: hypothetical protein DRP85_08640 [Candidatus Omnitrophota bacterium]
MLELVKPPLFEFGPLCFGCKHFRPRKLSCPAFPDGIPHEVLEGFLPHVEVLPEQQGQYVFEPAAEVPEVVRRARERRRFPKEWIEKWITYRGKRIPILKKEYRDKWRKTSEAIFHALVLGSTVVGVGSAYHILCRREADRLSRLLTEKGAVWVLPSDPLWAKVVHAVKGTKSPNPFLNWLHQHTGKYLGLKGGLALPQVRRTRVALATLESRFPGLLRDVRFVNYKMPRIPLIGGLTASDALKTEAGRLAANDRFWETYEKTLLSRVTKAGIDKDEAEMLIVGAGSTHRLQLLELGKESLKIGNSLFVAFPSSRVLGSVYPSKRYVYHEFGHVLQAKRDNLEKFITEAYTPYVARVLTPVARMSERLTTFEMEGFRDLFRTVVKAYKDSREARRNLLTVYSMTNPVEGYAEAFSFYIHKPKYLRERWPEAFHFFRNLEREWAK